MTQSVEYAGTLFQNEWKAQKAAIGQFIDGWDASSKEQANQMLEDGWTLPNFDGSRDELIDLIEQYKEEK